MNMFPKPNETNHFLAPHITVLCESFQRVTGKRLITCDRHDAIDMAKALFDAPYAVVSHDTSPDPVFNYANQTALDCFGMAWEDLIGLPSRYSAEPINREERALLLEEVTKKGFIDNYSGVRISKQGRRFLIKQATVWNVMDSKGRYQGQAAMFDHWEFFE